MKYLNTLFICFSLSLISSYSFGQCPVVAPVPNDACYQTVIANDSWCCNNSWDGICQQAYDDCINAGGGGGCPVIAPVPNDACYQTVIANDSWCCNNSWDALCQSAYDNCSGGGGGPSPCDNITPLIGCGTSTGANLSGPGVWDNGACGWSTPGNELIFSFTATATGFHTINVTSISGGFIDFMWIDATFGCSELAGWNCAGAASIPGSYGTMNMTAGNTYYILLDAEGTGAFSATFDIECPNPGTPAVAGDCNVAIPVCTNLAFQVDPSGYGLVDELCTSCTSNPGTNPSSTNWGCLLSGELNSTWFTVNVAAGGTLEFSFGAPGGGNCYDWIMWPYDANTCAGILADTEPPNACNWNSPCNSFTGMASTPPVGGDATNFEPTINVNTGDQFLICFSNYSSALTSVPLNFFGTADISCTVLPVELSSFQGQDKGGYTELNWETSSEINSSHFDVERSANGVDFIKINTISAAGTDLDGAQYRSYDYLPFHPVTYYRLKYVDYNQEYKYSETIAITQGKVEQFSVLSAFPNPANSHFTIQLAAPEKGEVYTEILDLSGQSHYIAKASLTEGIQFLDLPVHSLAAGSYFVVIYNTIDDKSQIVRMTVK